MKNGFLKRIPDIPLEMILKLDQGTVITRIHGGYATNDCNNLTVSILQIQAINIKKEDNTMLKLDLQLFASKKGVGSTKNGRDSHSKRLGAKRADGQTVTGWKHSCPPTRNENSPRNERWHR